MICKMTKKCKKKVCLHEAAAAVIAVAVAAVVLGVL